MLELLGVKELILVVASIVLVRILFGVEELRLLLPSMLFMMIEFLSVGNLLP